MGAFAAGHVALVRFPFSDLTATKLRPAVVLARAGRSDWILCQVTSNAYGDPRAIAIPDTDFVSGSLHRASYVRPGKLFTAHVSLMAQQIGVLCSEKFSDVRGAVIDVIRTG